MIAFEAETGQAQNVDRLDSYEAAVIVYFTTERLAQMDRASASEAEGRPFESGIAHFLGKEIEFLSCIFWRFKCFFPSNVLRLGFLRH